jgi:excisionase family DNA binding protein
MIPTKITVSRSECARLLGISVRLLDKCIQDGRINAVRLGDRVLILVSELDKFATQNSGQDFKKAEPHDKRRSKTSSTVRRRKVGR